VQLEVLAKAVRGEPPGPDMLESLLQTRAEICPYRGLRPFREEDARFFCGREVFTDTLVRAVGRRSVVGVVGASGSGKSSVVRAGLLPRLRRRAESGPVYEVVTMVPGDRPLHRLAAALVPLLDPELDEIQQLGRAGELAAFLQSGTVQVRDVVARALDKQPGTDRLLLVVDQWEELYTLCRDESVQRRFLAEILLATERDRLSMVLALRADFYGHTLGDRALADQLQDSGQPRSDDARRTTARNRAAGERSRPQVRGWAGRSHS
jgi:conflict system STAND superfamily ATPase